MSPYTVVVIMATDTRGGRVRLSIIVLSVVVALGVVGLAGCGGAGRSGPLDAADNVPVSSAVSSSVLPIVDNQPTLGSTGAPIKMVEFGDFTCPYCGMFALEIKPRIQREFIDTGKIEYVWRNFPVITGKSMDAAIAATCAHEQGAFWDYHDALFGLLRDEGHGAFDEEAFVALAAELQLDTARFAACLTENPHHEAILDDVVAAQELGVNATPAFLVNGYLIMGAHPFEIWEEFFNQLLEVEESPTS